MAIKTKETDNQFETRDIKLSAYLLARGEKLIDIETSPYSHHDSNFLLSYPSQDILDDWMNGAPCNGQRLLREYRMLLAVSKRKADEAYQRSRAEVEQ